MKIYAGTSTKIINELSNKIDATKNKDVFWNHPFDFLSEDPRYVWFVLELEEEIVGVIKTQKSIFYTERYPFFGINYIMIKEKFRGLGLAKELIESLFQYNQDGYLIGTEFTEEGQKLNILLKKMAIKYNVYYICPEIKETLTSEDSYPEKSELFEKYLK